MKPANLPEAEKAVERIVRDASRASEVIERIRRLARREPSEIALLDLNETAIETLALTRSEIKANGIHLRVELAAGLPGVMGDRVQLQQVILNLVINAIEALSSVNSGQRELVVSTASDGKSVDLAIQDSGKGLDTLEADRMFDPFHTSKQGGLGMGLTISRSIIETHGGRIRGAPAPRRGAVFTFTLPAFTDAPKGDDATVFAFRPCLDQTRKSGSQGSVQSIYWHGKWTIPKPSCSLSMTIRRFATRSTACFARSD